MRAFPILRALGYPVVYDVTHSLQLPGAGDGVTAGQAEFIEPMASAGVAAGVDGVFMEVHEEPAQAKSDAQNALRLDRLEPLLQPARPDPRRSRIGAGRMNDDDHRPRSRAQGAAHRSGRHPRPRRSHRRRRSSAPSSCSSSATAA